MIEHYVASLGLLRGCRVKDYESVTELETAAQEPGCCLRFSNKYLAEKSSLVDFRDKFTEELEKRTKFPWPMKVVEKRRSDGSIEKVEEPALTEVQYINLFRKNVLNGSYRVDHQLMPLENDQSANGEIKDEKVLEEALQALADSLGPFVADAKRPERVAKEKRPGKIIMERVKVIFDNGTQSHWWNVMKKEEVPIGIQTGDRAKDELALAWAIKEREERKAKEEALKYA